ncbi:hypothetical protein BASA50_011025 [Batrachochytrium salamandrivorans]|uniref:Uncharacterized protein n=1 Tax=Batrachochytrium salamandrivorans TaxID=1357716 RepID=A0ABQ8EWW2_9FUNG|nr:hypothetical protein BASA62_002984 [Batrachochytrium salamandrivorans]KAH6587933.1 hypothetical protein BASA50_011025 [Batrachochytrium salamandrivorans]KAH9253432.1 hypothetical protein BASA81_008629 [Batrachochytrium salamandrivorans]
MRVDTGIILSVLSFSVFAAVIPNHDYYVPLLVRRTAGINIMDFLWKRNGDDQMNFDGSGSGANGGGRSNSGLGKPSPFQSAARGVELPLPGIFKGQMTSYTMQRDSRNLEKIIKKLAEVVQGGNSRQVIPNIRTFLGTSLMSAKTLKETYDGKFGAPFFSSHKKATDYKSVTREVNRIKRAARELVETYLKVIYRAINHILKHPRDVMRELDKVLSSSTATFKSLISLCEKDYMTLISQMEDIDRGVYKQRTEEHVELLKFYQTRAVSLLNNIKGMTNGGVLQFKEKTPSKFSALKSRIRGG